MSILQYPKTLTSLFSAGILPALSSSTLFYILLAVIFPCGPFLFYSPLIKSNHLQRNTRCGMKVFPFQGDNENKNYASLLSKLESIQYKGETLMPGFSQAVWGGDKTCSHRDHKGFSPVVFPEQKTQLDPLPLMSLLPPKEDLGEYYRYEGSLTTPDCYEGVIWTIFEKPVELSLYQVSGTGTAWRFRIHRINSQCCVPAHRRHFSCLLPCTPSLGRSLNLLPSASCLTLLNHPPENGRKGAGRGNDGVRRKPRNPDKLSASLPLLPPAQPPDSRLFSHCQDSRTQQSQTQTLCPSAPALSSPVVTCRQEGEMELGVLGQHSLAQSQSLNFSSSLPACSQCPPSVPSTAQCHTEQQEPEQGQNSCCSCLVSPGPRASGARGEPVLGLHKALGCTQRKCP